MKIKSYFKDVKNGFHREKQMTNIFFNIKPHFLNMNFELLRILLNK